MILQLIRLYLHDIVTTQYHVLNQLRDFLVKLDHIGLPVHKILNHGPLRKLGIHFLLLGPALESANQPTQQLRSNHGIVLWLLDAKDV